MPRIVLTVVFAALAAALGCGNAPQPDAGVTPDEVAVTESRDEPSCAHDPSWTEPQLPFRVYGNTWYVGPRGLGVFLITAATGHVLIDGGVPGSAPMIEANIRSLGFEPADIKWILVSHAHCDHAGDVAALAGATGAAVLAGTRDAAQLARGGLDDPQYGDIMPYPAVHVTRMVADGERVQLGELTLTAVATAGHTKGNTTWTWSSCEQARCLQVVDVGSLSAPDYTLVGNARYPEIVADYRESFARVAALPCDVAIAPHPGMVDFWARVARRDGGEADALIDPTLCRAYAEGAMAGFDEKLAVQQSAR
ncbi:MAG: subclass B3 metallo-beta-lactamase [Gemmatimonadales bacterium]|nr:subclass B3 metallo-beta-lactamase [Gemmatimonadales bacterium]